MGKTLNEVEVLRFFEEGPIERADVVFAIVAEKMRERLRGRDGGLERAPAASRKRQPRSNAEATSSDSGHREPAA